MKYPEPDPARIKKARVIMFPRNRIVRIILKTGEPYDPPGPRYEQWDQPA